MISRATDRPKHEDNRATVSGLLLSPRKTPIAIVGPDISKCDSRYPTGSKRTVILRHVITSRALLLPSPARFLYSIVLSESELAMRKAPTFAIICEYSMSNLDALQQVTPAMVCRYLPVLSLQSCNAQYSENDATNVESDEKPRLTMLSVWLSNVFTRSPVSTLQSSIVLPSKTDAISAGSCEKLTHSTHLRWPICFVFGLLKSDSDFTVLGCEDKVGGIYS